ncbi:TonB family protein [Caulobacter sp. LARHSG274]
MFDPRPVLVVVLWLIVANSAQAQEASAFDTQLEPQAPLDLAMSPKDPDPAHYYPDRAQRMEKGGSALLSCTADPQGGLSDCALLSEAPEGWDFGAAALKMAKAGLIRKAPVGGAAGKVIVPVVFEPEGTRTPGGLRKPALPRRVAGALPKPVSSVAPGETILAFPFAFNRTAVLSADLTGFSIWVKGVMAPAGSPGFYAGTFYWSLAKASGEVWCFLPSPTTAPAKAVCVMVFAKLAVILPNINPYVITSFASSSGTFNYANAPRFEEKFVDIPGDLHLEYRFRRWTKTEVQIEELAGGRRASILSLPLNSDGRAKLETLAGDYWLTPAAGASNRVEVSAAAP